MKYHVLLAAWVVHWSLPVASSFLVNRQRTTSTTRNILASDSSVQPGFSASFLFNTGLSSSTTSSSSSSRRLSSSNSYLQDNIVKLWTVCSEGTNRTVGTPSPDANGHRNNGMNGFSTKDLGMSHAGGEKKPAAAAIATEHSPPATSREAAAVAAASPNVSPESTSNNNKEQEESKSYAPYGSSWKSKAPQANGMSPGSSSGESIDSGSALPNSGGQKENRPSFEVNGESLKSEASKDDNSSRLGSVSGPTATSTSVAAAPTRDNSTDKSKASSFAPNSSSWKTETPRVNGMGVGSTREKVGAIETSAYPAVDTETTSHVSPRTAPFTPASSGINSESNSSSFQRGVDLSAARGFGSPTENEDAIETSAYDAIDSPADTNGSTAETIAAPGSSGTTGPVDGTNKVQPLSPPESREQHGKALDANRSDPGPSTGQTDAPAKTPASSNSVANMPTQSEMGASPDIDNSTSLVDASLYRYSSGSWRLVERLEARKSKTGTSPRGTGSPETASNDLSGELPFTRKAAKSGKSDQSSANGRSADASKTKSFRSLYASWKSADFKHLLGIKGDDGTIETSASEEKDTNDSDTATEGPAIAPASSLPDSSAPAVNGVDSTMPTGSSNQQDSFNADNDSSSGYPETWGVSQPESDDSNVEGPVGGFVRKPKEGFVRKRKDVSADSARDYSREDDRDMPPESLLPGIGPFASSRSISEPPDAVKSDVYVTPKKGKTASSLKASSFFGHLYTSWRTADFKEIPSGDGETAMDTSRPRAGPREQPFTYEEFARRPPMDPGHQEGEHMPAPRMRQGGRENRFLSPQAGRRYPGPAFGAIQPMRRPEFWGGPPGRGDEYYPPGSIHPQQDANPEGVYDPSIMEGSSPGSFDRRYASFRGSGSKKRRQSMETLASRGADLDGSPAYSTARGGATRLFRNGQDTERSRYPPMPSEDPFSNGPSWFPSQGVANQADASGANGSSAGPCFDQRDSFRSSDPRNTQTRGVPRSGFRNMERPPSADQGYYEDEMYDGHPAMGRNTGNERTDFTARYASFKSAGVKNTQNSGRRSVPPADPRMSGPSGGRRMESGAPPEDPRMSGPSRGMSMGRGAPPEGPRMPGSRGMPMGRGAYQEDPRMSGSTGMHMGRGTPPQDPWMHRPRDRMPPENNQMREPTSRNMGTSFGAPPGPPPRGFGEQRSNSFGRAGDARTHADYHRLLMEIQQHLELLREFEGIIPPHEMERRKRELFMSLPPPLADNFDSTTTPPDDELRRPPSKSSFSSRYGGPNPYNRPY